MAWRCWFYLFSWCWCEAERTTCTQPNRRPRIISFSADACLSRLCTVGEPSRWSTAVLTDHGRLYNSTCRRGIQTYMCILIDTIELSIEVVSEYKIIDTYCQTIYNVSMDLDKDITIQTSYILAYTMPVYASIRCFPCCNHLLCSPHPASTTTVLFHLATLMRRRGVL